MSKLASFLVGMGNSYMAARAKTEKDAKDNEERSLRMQGLQLQIDRAKRENEREVAIEQATKPAAPMQVARIGEATVGATGPELATKDEFRVDGKNFDQMGDAQNAAKDYNKPESVVARIGAIDPARGLSMQRDLTQTRTGELDYEKKKRDIANEKFNSDLIGASTDPLALTKFMSDSHADGVGGAMKFEPKIEADGTWQIHQVHPDGQRKPFGPKFEAGEKGMMMAAYLIQKGVSPEQRLAHFNAVEDKRFARDITERKMRNDEQETANKGVYYGALGRAAGARADNRSGSSLRIPEAVKLEIQGIDNQIKAIDTSLSPTPKDQALRIDLANRRSAILNQYMPGGGLHMPDILGLRGDATQGTQQSGRAPTEQPAAKPPIAKMESVTPAAAPANWRAEQKGVVQPNRGGVFVDPSKLDRIESAKRAAKGAAEARKDPKVAEMMNQLANASGVREERVIQGQMSRYLEANYGITSLPTNTPNPRR